VNRFQFVADHQTRYGVKRLCTIIGLARSSYCYWKATADDRAARDAVDRALAGQIRRVHAGSDGTDGAPRITAELNDTGQRVNHKRVARVMRRFGVQGLRLRRRVQTTIADPAASKAPDLIGRDFSAPAVNQRYLGDITYLPVGERGFLYLATVIDLHSRRLAAGPAWPDTGLFFVRRDGRAWHPGSVSQRFRQLIQRGDFPPVRHARPTPQRRHHRATGRSRHQGRVRTARSFHHHPHPRHLPERPENTAPRSRQRRRRQDPGDTPYRRMIDREPAPGVGQRFAACPQPACR
jgi:hypothetical protein